MREHKVRTMMFANKMVKNEKGELEPAIVSKLLVGAPAHNPHASFNWYEGNIDVMFDFIVAELFRYAKENILNKKAPH